MSSEEVTMSEATGDGEQRILAGRYAIGEFIGQGGMATVYRGTDTKLGRQVAIKVMKANLAGDEQFRNRFRQEAQSASRMAHPTIVRVFDAGDDLIQTADGPQRLPFIVMEYVEGKNLRRLASEGRLSSAEACRIVDSVLTALEYSHRAGIVHRDIKPANIMITPEGHVKVMDFGIARAVSETSSTLQQTTAVLGTAAYFSPEQAKGEVVDARTDLYSTGVLLYELLTGDVPFRGDTAVAVAYQHVSERAQPPSSRDPEVSPQLDAVVMYSLAKDKAKRFQTAAEFRQALREAAAGTMPALRSHSDESTVLWSGGEEVTESDLALRQLTETGGASRTQSRPPVMWTWAAILTVGAVIIAVVFWLLTLVSPNFSPKDTQQVPDLAGVEREVAIDTLEKLGFVAVPTEQNDDSIEAGQVIATDPVAGTNLTVDSTIKVFVSTGPQSAEVPDVDHQSLEDYRARVEALGLVIGTEISKDDPVEKAGRVLSVNPAPGTLLHSGASIEVTYSSGMVSVPNVRELPLDTARKELEALRLQVDPQDSDACSQAGRTFPVIDQSLDGTQPQESKITITYCTGVDEGEGGDFSWETEAYAQLSRA